MRISTIASAALFCASTAVAVPVEAVEAGEKGWSVYMSTDWDWGNREQTGLFQNVAIKGFGSCVTLKDAFGAPWDKTLSSFGPGKSIKCIVYDAAQCKGNSMSIWYSGYARLEWLGWDNRISSYECGYCNVGIDEGCRDNIS